MLVNSRIRNLDSIGLPKMPSYAASTGNMYSRIYYPNVGETLEKQGFKFADPEK